MPQDQCQCQSGSHGHEPGECKNAMTHEEDHMCDYCHDKADDLLSRLENKLLLGGNPPKHARAYLRAASRSAFISGSRSTSPLQ
jgi:hypothetical protein